MGVCRSKLNKKELISIDSLPIKNEIPALKEYKFCDYRESLINGYIHYIEEIVINNNKLNEFYIFSIIPSYINKLIISYYPLYQIYGIGANFGGLWESDKNLEKFTSLNEYSKLLIHSNNIYYGNYCYFLLNNFENEIYGIGRNYYNELCLNSSYNYPFIDRFQKIDTFYNNLYDDDKGSKIEFISTGIYGYTSKSIVFKLNNGSIYLSSNNYIDGNCFISFNRIERSKVFLSSDKNIIQIECGIAHILFLSDNGRVYGMGNNNYSQIGFPFNLQNRYKKINHPILIEKLVENQCFIKTISCGKNHNVLCDKNNNAPWCFGDNSFKQCSSNDNIDIIMEPQIYKNNKNIIKAQCGMDFTVCLDSNGNCYGFGDFISDLKNNTNINHDDDEYNLFKLSDSNILFIDISVGNKHIILISNDNKIYSFGINTCNQCGFDSNHYDKICDTKLLTNDLFPNLKNGSNVKRVIAALNQTLIIYQ